MIIMAPWKNTNKYNYMLKYSVGYKNTSRGTLRNHKKLTVFTQVFLTQKSHFYGNVFTHTHLRQHQNHVTLKMSQI